MATDEHRPIQPGRTAARRAIQALVLSAALVGSWSAGWTKPTPKATAPNPVLAAAKADVARQLNDPSSAQFRNVHITIDALGAKKVCGEVNAKNRFGGYVGFRLFVYIIEAKTAQIESDENYLGILADGC